MINTKCQECMFSSISMNSDEGCSKNIIHQIKDIKTITQDPDGFNVIHEYACRYGFSKHIYSQHKNDLDSINFEDRLALNSKVRLYLILDCNQTTNFEQLADKLNNLSIKPAALSMIFRSSDQDIFSDNLHSKILNNKLIDIKWKAHKFIENSDLEFAVDHILSTNNKPNNSSHILVYNIEDIDSLNQDIVFLNKNIMLYQKPHIAIVDKNHKIYRLCITFENYKVAKNIGENIIKILSAESNVILY